MLTTKATEQILAKKMRDEQRKLDIFTQDQPRLRTRSVEKDYMMFIDHTKQWRDKQA